MTFEAPRFNCIDLPLTPLTIDSQPFPSSSSTSSSSLSTLECPPAPFLPSCHNFHCPSPIRGSTIRFSFLDDLSSEYRDDNDHDIDHDMTSEGTLTPVRHPWTTGLKGGNLLGLFVDDCTERDEEEERNKGVLRAALERMELDPRYMDAFDDSEDEDEDYLTYSLNSPFSPPPPLIRRDSSSSSDEYSSSSNSTGDYSPPPPLTFGRFGSARKFLTLDGDVRVQGSSRSGGLSQMDREIDDVQILDLDDKAEEAVEEGPYRYRRYREDEDAETESFSSSLDPALVQALGGMGGWRIPPYLRRESASGSGMGSGCTSTGTSTPSFKSLTPVGWENPRLPSFSLSAGERWQTTTEREDTFMTDEFQPSSSFLDIPKLDCKSEVPLFSSRSGCTKRRSDDGLPEKRRKLEHRSARIIDGTLFP